MKNSILFAIMFAAAGLMMSACNNTPKDDGKQPVEDVNTKKVEVEKKAPAEDQSGIVSIRKAWVNNPIDAEPGDITPGIETFAYAFCDKYSQCETNKALANYFVDPNEVNKEMYEIVSDPKNGYVHSMMKVQTTPVTDACFWNRNNEHQLFAAYMENTTETGETTNLVVFYDYDPMTQIMTPEPALTNMIEERMTKYSSYQVVLPQNGKDIQVVGFIEDEANDSADRLELKLKWNGMTFDWEN